MTLLIIIMLKELPRTARCNVIDGFPGVDYAMVA